ncbi:hypothetical protein FSP39_004669 [Pinctada imbricata]|uniref:Guanylate cyclase n=1 Tax=Pinctada imbricata TaxID=66713 RepID=A0AA88YPV8_PINIB|nr:hypothetical protein FSP39_004669 [Pinctada imbricata]
MSKSDRSTNYTTGNTNLDSLSEARRNSDSEKVPVARYSGKLVVVKPLNKRKLKIDRKLLKEMKQTTELKHSNLVTLYGICTDADMARVVWEYCPKGSVKDVIDHEDIKLDTMFKLSIANDILKGLDYIHKSDLRFHGNLKSSNCLIDSRWTCKLTDFGPRHIRGENIVTKTDDPYEKYSTMIPIAELASYRNIPVFGWISNEETLDNKTKLDTLSRLIPPITELGGIFSYFILIFNWLRFVIISSEDAECNAYANAFISTFESTTFSFTIAHHYARVDVNVTEDKIDDMLNAIKYEGRIVILIVPESELRTYMVRAAVLGMAEGDYQFLFVKTVIPTPQDKVKLATTQLWWRGDGLDSYARRACESLLFIVFADYFEDTSSWEATSRAATETLLGNNTNMPPWAEPDIYSPFLHDAVYMYAKALNQSGGDPDAVNGTSIAEAAARITFKGLSGDVVMSYLHDRYPDITVYDMTAHGNFTIVAYLRFVIENSYIDIKSNVTTIRWGNGQTSADFTPKDTPACGFYNENCPVKTTSYVPLYIGLTVGMMLVLLIMYIIYRIWRREKDLQNMAWKIRFKDLDFSVGKQMRSFMNLQNERSSDLFLNRRGSIMSKSDRSTNYTTGNTNLDSLSEARRNSDSEKVPVARYSGKLVVVKPLNKRKLKIDRKLLKEMKQTTELKHSNLVTLYGICTDADMARVVWEYCPKGSVKDVIDHEDIKLDTMFKLSIANDILKGLDYIHKSDLRFHGNLKSSNCLIDSRWTCKLTDFGPRHIRGENIVTKTDDPYEKYSNMFWSAPEILRKEAVVEKKCGSQAGDVYAFGIIAKELICRDSPYCCEVDLTPEEIISKLKDIPTDDKPFRPKFPRELDGLQTVQQSYAIKRLIQRCWVEDPLSRPTVRTILKSLNKINPFKKANVIENMVIMMEKYSTQLEDLVAERTSQLQEEKRKTDALLYRMLPRKVAEDLKLGYPVQAESFSSVTIYFSDIVGFTTLAGDSTPMQVVHLLNALYTLFDDTIEHFDVYKVETIGDAYMIVSGLPERNGDKHVTEIATAAIELLEAVKRFEIPHLPGQRLQIRIGLHTGPVVAGVVGLTMPRYCLFGDTVNTASRMESNGKALKIHVSGTTYGYLENHGGYQVEERGILEIKGKGSMTTYWLESRKPDLWSQTSQIRSRDRPLTPGTISVTEDDLRDNIPCDRTSIVSEEAPADRKTTYVSFMPTQNLPSAMDMDDISDDLAEMFDPEK